MKGGEHVRIIIDGNPKEIAALVLAVQGRRDAKSLCAEVKEQFTKEFASQLADAHTHSFYSGQVEKR